MGLVIIILPGINLFEDTHVCHFVIGNVVWYEEAEIDKPVFFSFLFLFFSFLHVLS